MEKRIGKESRGKEKRFIKGKEAATNYSPDETHSLSTDYFVILGAISVKRNSQLPSVNFNCS